MNNFKEELFLKIYNDTLKEKDSLDESQRTRILEEVIRIKTNLDNEECSLEDFRFPEEDSKFVTLSDAVERLAHELEIDGFLYESYRTVLINCMVVHMSELIQADGPGQLMEVFHDISDDFLKTFIKDVKHNKVNNE